MEMLEFSYKKAKRRMLLSTRFSSIESALKSDNVDSAWLQKVRQEIYDYYPLTKSHMGRLTARRMIMAIDKKIKEPNSHKKFMSEKKE